MKLKSMWLTVVTIDFETWENEQSKERFTIFQSELTPGYSVHGEHLDFIQYTKNTTVSFIISLVFLKRYQTTTDSRTFLFKLDYR